jgi:hypothetical protein
MDILADLHTAVPSVDDLAGLGSADLAETLRQVDRLRRAAEVALAEGVALAERRRDHLVDGHRSVIGWCRGEFDWSNTTAHRIARNGRALASMPTLRAAASEAAVGVDQLDTFGRVRANPRCTDELAACDDALTELATRFCFADFAVAMRRWEALADADGARQRHVDAHGQRCANVSIVGEQVFLDAHGGTADGVFLAEVFQRYRDAEFQRDWAEARERVGADVSAADLARTDAQRRFDALMAVFRDACAAPTVAADPEPLVNIVVDQATAEELLARAAGGDVADPDPTEFATRRCETVGGVPLHPAVALSAMLVGRIRRVVYGADGVVIDLGRRSRLFRGGARDAVLLANLRCLWPGCSVPAGLCHTDHVDEWARHGPTSPSNGATLCSHHNRYKNRGYTLHRDAHGAWHVLRPDGSEIGESDQPTPRRRGGLAGWQVDRCAWSDLPPAA